jgi:hypothetical protein
VEVEKDIYDAGAILSRLGIPILSALDELPGDDAERLLAAANRQEANRLLGLRICIQADGETFNGLLSVLEGKRATAPTKNEEPPSGIDAKTAAMVEKLAREFPVMKCRRSAAKEE